MMAVKSIVYWLIISVVIFLFSSHAHSTSPQQLTFLNWSEYLSPELVKKFEDQFNVQIHQVTFDSDDNRNQLLVSTDGANFDVVLVDGDSIQGYVRRGWLAKLSETEIPNIKNIIQIGRASCRERV